MEYREVPGTGIEISVVGFGTGDNGGLMVKGEPKERLRAVERALDLGVNYFDTAPDYGKGLAETHLGEVLKQIRERPVLCTKVEVMPEHLADVAGRVTASVEASLGRLGVDYVDFVMMHNPPHLKTDLDAPGWIGLSVNEMIGPGGALEGLQRMREQGKVGYFGFTLDSLDIEAVDAVLETGEFNFINAWYNLINPSAAMPTPRGLSVGYDFADVITHAYERGVGVACIGPHGRGALTDHALRGGARHPVAAGALSRNEQLWKEAQENAKAFGFLSKEGQTLQQAAIRFVLHTPGIITVNGGFSELSHLDEMVANASHGPLTREEMARVQMVWHGNLGRR